MCDLKFLVNSRKYLRKSVTEEYNKRGTYSSLTSSEKATNRLVLEELLKDLNDLDSRIRPLKWEEDKSEAELEKEIKTSKEYSRKIRECFVLLEVTPTGTDTTNEATRSLLKSPIAPLPKYGSGGGEDLHKFINQFEETLSKYTYTDYDKLLLLKQQVSGRASILLNALESDKQSYAEAKQLLIDALASPVVRKFNVLKQLADIKLLPNADPFEYVSKMKSIMESVKVLKIDVDSVLQYFFWSGLTEDFRSHLVQITNKSKPSLQEIADNFFEACERYQNKCKFRVAKKENFSSLSCNEEITTGLAVKVNYPIKAKSFRSCPICSKLENKEVSHALHKCPKFNTASDKVRQINLLNGCTKCSSLSHLTKDCKFSFNSRCSKCHNWHMNYLCTSFESNNLTSTYPKSERKESNHANLKSKANEVKSKDTVSSLTVTEALQNDVDGESILPTFTCEINGAVLRGLKDGGCQSNFISSKIADRLDLKVLKDNIPLTVRGINVPKKYITKLVEARIKFGTEERIISALCLPYIDIVLNLPNLHKVVDGFVNKGYQLADKKLKISGDKIDNIDIILGTKSAYCISESEVAFGQEKCSVYSQTPQGIMLKGDIGRLISDLDLLPDVSSFSDNSPTSSSFTVPLYSLNLSKFCGTNYSSSSGLGSNLGDHDIVSDDALFSYKMDDQFNEVDLQKAAETVLDSQCSFYTNHDVTVYEDQTNELNSQLIDFALDNTVQQSDGRLKMPLLWNSNVSHLLGKNRNLASMILKSNLKNFPKNAEKIKLMDSCFKEQEAANIVERIENLEEFLELHPQHSFLPHMAVLKPDRETTKCRIVFLSNLCESEKGKSMSISHNQAIHAGPSLNQKISSSLLHLRFDPKILVFDIKKAFNNIVLDETDQNRLLFLWFRNVSQNDFSIVGYRNIRLSFGLRCSPTLLMLALFKILVLDTDKDNNVLRNLKSLIYQLCYMDNCAITTSDSSSLIWAYEQLPAIFNPYCFGLQQFASNDETLQSTIDANLDSETPTEVKLLGMRWDRVQDTLSTKPINLNINANTKREILTTIASHFDIYNYDGPVLNRSRLFLHGLQCQKDLGWDEPLTKDQVREWKNIVKQANSTPNYAIKRSVGKRDGKYKLIAFCDSSKVMFGVVIYIKDVETGEVSFLLSKNRIINKQLESKSIPSLEMQSIDLAAECLTDLYAELSGPLCMKPIYIENLEIYSDSLVSLAWLNSYATKMDKMQKKSIFVLNRIHHINSLCEKNPIRFSFVSGSENPADCVTRCISYKQLLKTNFFSGPDFLKGIVSPTLSRDDVFSIIIPNPEVITKGGDIQVFQSITQVSDNVCSDHVVSPDIFSKFSKIISVYSKVLIFINKLKLRLKEKFPSKFEHFPIYADNFNYSKESSKQIIKREQALQYPDIVQYFNIGSKRFRDVPNLVAQLNLYMDQDGLLRVRSKCERLKNLSRFDRFSFPLLLSKKSRLTDLIILDIHQKFSHAGCYSLLSELRKQFWVPHFFAVVKRVLKSCIVCRRYNERTVKLNQSPYRLCRLDPCNIPFSNVYMDFMGPFLIKNNGIKEKIWILCITCMWSRAINLKICLNQSTSEFLRAFQLHCFEYGLPQLCITDLGTQLIAGASTIQDFLKDHESKRYFDENGVQKITFEQYYKGRSELGSMVEICVKLTKRLMSKAIGKNILSLHDFEFFVCKTVHLVNRRPVAFKEALRDSTGDNVPGPITPECLIRGYNLISMNVIPDLQSHPEYDWLPYSDPQSHIKTGFEQLKKVRQNLIEIYNEEFLGNLICQAVNLKDRYRPVTHKHLVSGDIVLIKEPFAKPSNYPMGVVKKVIHNENGEVTGAMVLKGKSRELLKRHSSTLIPLMMLNEGSPAASSDKDSNGIGISEVADNTAGAGRPKRQAAVESERRTRDILLEL